jgi:DNA-binding transcriptional LysR family regulator
VLGSTIQYLPGVVRYPYGIGMELRHMRYFVAVAEERHVGRAADRLEMAQPPLTRQIRQLEAIIGTPLFDRTPRGMALTGAGRRFLRGARAILVRADLAADNARKAAGQGHLSVGYLRSRARITCPN